MNFVFDSLVSVAVLLLGTAKAINAKIKVLV